MSGSQARSPGLIAAVAALPLCGCAVSQPQSAAEFRAAAAGSPMAAMETFDVDRPLAQVTASFRRLASECLDRTVTTRDTVPSSVPGYYQTETGVYVYHPAVSATADGAQLSLQRHDQCCNIVRVSREPDGGYFLLVADARPVSAARTRVDLYRPRLGYGKLGAGIRSWAAGEATACPDLAP